MSQLPTKNSTSSPEALPRAVVVRLTGGLGNQMFQYATARALALRHGVALALDLTWFADPTAAANYLAELRAA